MRQRNKTETSFNKLMEITQVVQALQVQRNSKQTSDNANTSEITNQSTPKPKGTARTKNSTLKPTKRAFSERQRITIRDNSQASAKEIKRGR
ncbi:hypothetical protein CV728_08395 [Helicobacter pylori]|uniref:Hac prophage II protein n=1 Tax=Helicobacter pylori TaxID=210 RepID=A0A518YI58_HELPX|nr:hypothetical protein [Helicobacter pylori]QDY61448.1 hypothetical protein CV728_08395 [Helicobacter pylori]